uniref:intelectin-1-like n=1 Tax=Styela clava TaxID=7725 RepID=UPI0019399EFD|nr:intelectin-1-like [Styela clava]
MIPPHYRPHVEPGFLQFRAYNLTGYPNALCPGVKVKSISPEFSCIGGLSNDATKYGTCGDFAGWGGKLDDIIAQSSANGSAHSQNDISSSILIFYR